MADHIFLKTTGVEQCKPKKKMKTVLVWRNQTALDYWVVFTAGQWPFAPPQVAISVPAGGDSAPYQILDTWADGDRFDYVVTLDVDLPSADLLCKADEAKKHHKRHDDDGPPDGPAVIVDDP